MPARQASQWIKIVAILQIAFGALGIALGLLGLLQVAMGTQPGAFGGGGGTPQAQQMQKELQEGLQRVQNSLPGGMAVQYGQIAFGLLLSALMIASGAGMLKLQPWGRSLAIGYAVASLLDKVFSVVYIVAFTLPAIDRFMTEFGAKGAQQQMVANFARIAAYASVVGPVVLSIYPLFVLIFMLKASTRKAFSPEAAGESAEDEGWGRTADRGGREEDRYRRPDDRYQ